MRCSALVALLSGVVLYLAMGALVFRTLEAPQEDAAYKELHHAMVVFRQNHSCVSEQEFNSFIRKVLSAVGAGLDATSDPANFTSRWDLVSAFFFCGTIITTIGFGNLSPRTRFGQLFCVCYALVGIPMFGILLAGVGDHMGTVLRRAVAKIETIFLKRKVSPTMVRVISAVLSILIGCIIFLAVPTLVFHEVEDWTFLESLYCVVITLTTIGFGDFVPVGDREADVLFKPLVLLWIVFGLSYFASILTMIGNWLRVLSKRTRTEMEEFAEELAAHATDWTQNIQNMSMDFRIPNPLEFNDPFLLQRRRWKRSERRRLRRGAQGTLGYRERSGSQNGHLPNRWVSLSRSMNRLEVHPLAESALTARPRLKGTGGATVPRVGTPRLFARSLSLPVACSTCELDSPEAATQGSCFGSESLYDSTSSSFSSASSLAQHIFKPSEAVSSMERGLQNSGTEPAETDTYVTPDGGDLHTEMHLKEEMPVSPSSKEQEQGVHRHTPSPPPLLPSSAPPQVPPSLTPPLPSLSSPSCQLLDFFGENFAYIDESSDTLSDPVQPGTDEAMRRRPRKPKRKSMRRQLPQRWSPVQRRRLNSNNEPPSNPPTPPPDFSL